MTRAFELARSLERRLDQRNPAARLAKWRVHLERANGTLTRLLERVPAEFTRRLERAVAALNAEDPTRPLERGFAIISKNGVAVNDAATLSVGDMVSARLWHGTFDACVETVHAP
jgi:exodeoxyribonuclease VII large subunit